MTLLRASTEAARRTNGTPQEISTGGPSARTWTFSGGRSPGVQNRRFNEAQRPRWRPAPPLLSSDADDLATKLATQNSSGVLSTAAQNHRAPASQAGKK